MAKNILVILLLILTGLTPHAQPKATHDVYLFGYFKGGGTDGLHLAYSYDGLKWETLKNDSSFLQPAVAKDKLMRDPCIMKGADGLYHMVWTVSWNDKGIGYASSPDLVHWSEQQFLPVMAHEPQARNCWAPEINYDAGSKTYIIYWATTITGRFPLVDTTAEAKYNHRLYYVTTKDFKTYSQAQLLYEPGYNVIDATIVSDKKQFVMFFKDETRTPVQKNIKLAYANKLTGPYNKPEKAITGNYWAEGPTAIQIKGKWIVYFDRYRDHRYGALTSDDLKTWTDISDQLSLPQGIRHGTVFKVTATDFNKLIASI
ncbi:glycoside hydrolase family 43 protein [Mucilaginibacter robiniae]|uniref:Glycoside hydrolase family 43 protein n=1 Tax=Mucilaginibacter robiniae TaxID=2728022 RepID=A0A7L5DWW1_9SPHI|nr:glycoside hydrolase family 43 protein [Mucilaginibacter robiniae]QJD95241.1 glycoside hydrolase family 43 protein [Mucilaginibacter robiniae]